MLLNVNELIMTVGFREAAALCNRHSTISLGSNMQRNSSPRESNFLALLALSFLVAKWSAVLLSNLMSFSSECSTLAQGPWWSPQVHSLQCVICQHTCPSALAPLVTLRVLPWLSHRTQQCAVKWRLKSNLLFNGTGSGSLERRDGSVLSSVHPLPVEVPSSHQDPGNSVCHTLGSPSVNLMQFSLSRLVGMCWQGTKPEKLSPNQIPLKIGCATVLLLWGRSGTVPHTEHAARMLRCWGWRGSTQDCQSWVIRVVVHPVPLRSVVTLFCTSCCTQCQWVWQNQHILRLLTILCTC